MQRMEDASHGVVRSAAADWVANNGILLARAAAYLAALLVVGPFFYHLAHGSPAYLGLLEDDYFYYAEIADNWVAHGKITYDGATLTNGFHPLWFLVIAAMRAVAGGFGPTYYVALAVISCIALLATYELTRRFAQALGAESVTAAALAAIYAVGAGRLLTTGLECAIAVPLLLWFLIEIARPDPVTAGRACKLGFIASLAVLARLDIGIAITIAIAGYLVLVRPKIAVAVRLLAAFACGGLLIPIYAAINLYYFHSLLPVSALAKRVQTGFGFDLSYARAVAFSTFYGPTIAIVLPLGAFALSSLFRADQRRLPHARFAGAVALSFAFVFFAFNALTGWIFFGWYAYPLQSASIAALVFIVERWQPWFSMRVLRVAVLAAAVVLAPAMALRYYVQRGPLWSVADNSLLAMSYDLAEHMRNKQGVFAMGACAGVAGYMLDKPIVQLEAIVSDRGMVDHLRRQDPLPAVLQERNVDYLVVSYVGSKPTLVDGCYVLSEPNPQWAGKRSAAMRGVLCSDPVERFVTPAGSHPWSAFPQVETLIWSLRDAHWRG
jgi:hypothetical protein